MTMNLNTNMTTNLKRIWTGTAVFALGLVIFLWFDNDSPNLLYTILALDAVMFALSLPCSIFFAAVFLAARHFLGIEPVSVEGAYLDTVFLLVLGFVQWFWITKVWSPTEPPLQNLNLAGANSK